ncbi:hypothetical protein QTP86_022968 [Hemibagrus guttatus]|nr:hypothetical protein QTP86_022968 [Hemibagrus guttatus]
MLEHGVRYGQALTSTEVQQQDTTQVQIRGAVPPHHAPPGITVVAHMGVEVPQQNYGVPSWSTFQHPSQGLQEGWVLHTAIRPISRNNSETPIPGPKAQGNNPLVYRGKLQHMAAELGGYKQAHPSLTPLTMGHSREEESPTSLKEVWVTGAPAYDRYPKHIAPDPYAPSCGWWAYGKVGLRRFFGLCPAESRRQRLGHQALACVPQPQAWLQDPAAPPVPVIQASSSSVVVGVNLQLSCTVVDEQDIVVDFTWEYPGQKIGRPLYTQETMQTVQVDGRSRQRSQSVLQVDEVREVDEGTYTCTAQNLQGSRSISTNIKVQKKHNSNKPHTT